MREKLQSRRKSKNLTCFLFWGFQNFLNVLCFDFTRNTLNVVLAHILPVAQKEVEMSHLILEMSR